MFEVGPSGKPNWQENKKAAPPINKDTADPRAAFDNISVGKGATQMGGPNGGVDPKVVNQPKHYTDY